MNTLEIICDTCDAQMRLSPALLSRIVGKTGRVTCKQCQGRVTLDGRGDEIAVISGATVVEALELEEVAPSAPFFADDIRFSEAPAHIETQKETRSSLPPPLPRAAQLKAVAPEEPGLLQLADQIRTAVDREPLFEAPPPMRAQEDSLSPHAIDDEEDGLVHLGREFRSSPFSSERDATYQSLYPQNTRRSEAKAFDAPLPLISKAPLPPRAKKSRKADPSPLDSDLTVGAPVGAVSVILGPDGTLLNEADLHPPVAVAQAAPRQSSKAPWLIAAVSLLALGVSVGLNMRGERALSPGASSGQAAHALPVAPQATQATPAAAAPVSDVPVSEVEDLALDADVLPAQKHADAKDDTEAKSEKEKVTGDEEAKDKVAADAAGTSAPLAETTDAVVEVPAEEAAPEQLPPFSAGAASAALRDATALATGCRGANDPEGTATVLVTFAPSGRVTQAAVSGAPFAGTATGGCIASRFREARVPAFSGDFVTVKKTVTIK